MVLHDSICKDCKDTVRITGAYIVFYQGGPIDHCTHVTGPVDQYSDDSEYNETRTVGTDIAHFRMINNDLLNKYPYLVP